jgi:hypothetical protein
MGHTLKSWGLRLGRKWHRRLILLGLIVNAISALAFFLLIVFAVFDHRMTVNFLVSVVRAADAADAGGVLGQAIRIALNVAIGFVALAAIIQFVRKHDRSGLTWGLVQIVLSLTLLQLVTFYLNQFTAIIPTMIQFLMLGILLTYQAWYLDGGAGETRA